MLFKEMCLLRFYNILDQKKLLQIPSKYGPLSHFMSVEKELIKKKLNCVLRFYNILDQKKTFTKYLQFWLFVTFHEGFILF